jgi:hypothetical protein
MNQEGIFKPALIGGVLLGILSALPLLQYFNCFCCAWIIGGGMLSAHLYVKNSPTAVTLGTGVLLGLLAGAIGAVVDTIFSIPLFFALKPFTGGLAEQMQQILDRFSNLPPETRDAVRSLFAGGASIGLLMILLSGLVKLFFYSLICMLGGAIGVAVFEKRKPGAPPMGPPPYYPPPPDLPPPPQPTPGAGEQ